jgi:cytochrome c biogenesis protein CcmG, thiol:disulfide interchange protein DsbE
METVTSSAGALPATKSTRRFTRALLLLAPALLFIGLLAAAVLDRQGPPQPGDPAPGFSAPSLGAGSGFDLERARGKPVLLNFWASWCPPCRAEAPMLQRAARRYAGDVTFVGVDVKDSRSDALRFAERYGLDYTLVRDTGGEVAAAYGLTGQPESFFIDSDGTVVEHVAGPLFEDDLQQLLDVLVRRDA